MSMAQKKGVRDACTAGIRGLHVAYPQVRAFIWFNYNKERLAAGVEPDVAHPVQVSIRERRELCLALTQVTNQPILAWRCPTARTQSR